MDYKPLIFSLILIFIIGIILPLAINSITDIPDTEPDGVMALLINLIDSGISIFGFSLNPFDFFPSIKEIIINNLLILSLIPSIILTPLIIIIIISITYTIIKLLPTT